MNVFIHYSNYTRFPSMYMSKHTPSLSLATFYFLCYFYLLGDENYSGGIPRYTESVMTPSMSGGAPLSTPSIGHLISPFISPLVGDGELEIKEMKEISTPPVTSILGGTLGGVGGMWVRTPPLGYTPSSTPSSTHNGGVGGYGGHTGGERRERIGLCYVYVCVCQNAVRC